MPWNSDDSPPEVAPEQPRGSLPLRDQSCCSAFPVAVPVITVCPSLFAVGVSRNVVTVLLIGRYREHVDHHQPVPGQHGGDGAPFNLYRLWRSRP